MTDESFVTADDDASTAGRPYAEILPRAQEQLLMDLLPEVDAARILCTSAGMAQFAHAAAVQHPRSAVYCHYLDIYHADRARHGIGQMPENLAIGCAADFPTGEIDLAAFPFSAQGEAELTRELMQAGHQLLAVGGRMLASTNNPRDKWLQAEMEKLFDTVTRRPSELGVAYIATKKRPIKRVVNFASEFVFRDRDRLITAFSRPGVFSHRRVDPGARQLLNAMEVREGERVLDIGCGCGTVALAAALRAPAVRVHAVDSSTRAVQCTQIGVERNGLTNVSAELNASGDYEGKGQYDLVAANPPYYANFRIAELFLRAGRAALRPGGRILVVTKSPEWYQQHMPQWFEHVQITPSKDYHIVFGQ